MSLGNVLRDQSQAQMIWSRACVDVILRKQCCKDRKLPGDVDLNHLATANQHWSITLSTNLVQVVSVHLDQVKVLEAQSYSAGMQGRILH